MSAFFLIIGLGLLAKAGWTYYKMARWLASAQTTQGKVEGHIRGPFLISDAKFALVRFAVDGKPIVFKDKWPIGVGSGGVGETIPVWYNPKNPLDALVNADVIRWSLPASWILVALLFLAMSYGFQGL